MEQSLRRGQAGGLARKQQLGNLGYAIMGALGGDSTKAKFGRAHYVAAGRKGFEAPCTKLGGKDKAMAWLRSNRQAAQAWINLDNALRWQDEVNPYPPCRYDWEDDPDMKQEYCRLIDDMPF